MDIDELAAWLRLQETPGLGLAPARQLLAVKSLGDTASGASGASGAGGANPANGGLNAAERRILSLMGQAPVTLDELLNRGAGTATEVSAHLLDLELRGQVARLAGQLFQRRVTG